MKRAEKQKKVLNIKCLLDTAGVVIKISKFYLFCAVDAFWVNEFFEVILCHQ